MDWLRSCYSSEWRLFADSPATLVRGRYYFSPAGTPFVSGGTLFGSRAWDGNGTISGKEPPGSVPVVLGEVRGQPQRWDSGALPVQLPLAQQVGSSACLLAGDDIAEGIPADQAVGGFVPKCFLPAAQPNPDFEFGFSVWSCPTQLFWADQITLLYADQFADVMANCTRRFAGASVTITKQTTLYPALAVIVNPAYVCVAVTGTGTLYQALVQIIQGFAGPQDFGLFGTSVLWYNFATVIMQAIGAAGAMDGRPILLAGHSYGGAACLVAAARISAVYPNTELRYITFGSPKPGDQRLRTLLDGRYDGLSLVNDGDLITALPPSAAVLEAMSSVGPFGFVLGWTQWVFPPETTLLYQNQVLKNTYQRYDSRSLVAYLQNVISTGQLATVPAHLSPAYSGKIRQRCTEFLPTPFAVVLAWNVTKTVTSVILPPCCPSGVPQTFHVSISGCTGANAVYNGATGTLAWSGSAWQWNLLILTVDGLLTNPLECNPGFGWSIAIGGSPFLISGAAIGNACLPFSIGGTITGPRGTSPVTFNFS